MTLKSGAARTIFVEVPSHMAPEAVVRVAVVLNERLAGLTLREIRATLSDRLRDAAPDPDANQLLKIFIQEADELFDVPSAAARCCGGRHQEGVPQARDGVSPRPQQRRQDRRRALQADHGGVRGAS